MKQSDRELLLLDLSMRVPYHVKVMVPHTIPGYPAFVKTLSGINPETNYILADLWMYVDRIKPYLRPISSMTEEEMDKVFHILNIPLDGSGESWIKFNDVTGIKFFIPEGVWVEDMIKVYDYLNSIHIDYRGLIPKDLAIEVTKENNPYAST